MGGEDRRDTQDIEKGILIEGEVHVMNCNLRVCVKKDKRDTVFCKFLIGLNMNTDGYLVRCDSIYKGRTCQ